MNSHMYLFVTSHVKMRLYGIAVCASLLFFGLFVASPAQAAIGTGSATCSASSNTSNTSLACTVATEAIEAGNVAVMIFASDNSTTADGNDRLLATVTDSDSNSWSVKQCFTNSQAAAASGATVCVATSRITNTLSVADTITATLGTARTAKAIVVREFTVGTNMELQITGAIQQLANDALDPGSMTVSGLPSAEYLFIRAIALERSNATLAGTTTSFTATGCNGAGTTAAGMNACGEFRIFTGTSLASDPAATAVDSASLYMAFSEVDVSFTPTAATCTANNTTAANTTVSCTLGAAENIEAGNAAVMLFSTDNTATTDGATQNLTSVTDSGGNTWTVRQCFTNGQAGAAAGATVCVATSKISTTLTASVSTITANYLAATAKSFVVREFVIPSGYTLQVVGTTQTLANDALDPGNMTLSGLTGSSSTLFVRATALERNVATWTAGFQYTPSSCAIANTTVLATSMTLCGEFRIHNGTAASNDPIGTAVDSASLFMAFRITPDYKSIGGTVYVGEGTTPLSGSTIKMAVGSLPPNIVSTTTNASGVWSINTSMVGVSAGAPVVVWVDGDDTLKATLFTKLANVHSNVSGLDLYRNNVIVRSEEASDITADDMDFYDALDDQDIQYVVDESSDTLYLKNDQQLFVWAGDTFTGATTTVIAGDIKNNGGTLDLSGKMTLLAGTGELTGTEPSLGDVVIGSTTAMRVTNDGVTWTARTATEANSWQAVTYGNGIFVAVSVDGTNRVMTSPDGITWTARTAGDVTSLQAVTYGNGVFVSVTNAGTNRVVTSPDGITWTARTAAEANQWTSVTYGNGIFVAVSLDGTNRVMTSPDGITWTARAAAEANTWYSVTYGNGLFVAVANSGTNRVMTSPDGITWTARAASEANSWRSVTYGNGLFVAVAQTGTNRVMTSPDGITWTARAAAEANQWWSVTYGNGLFVALSSDGTNRVMTSPDGITWTARAASEANTWKSAAYGNGLFVAVAQSGTNRVMTSDSGELLDLDPYKNDGQEWTFSENAEDNSWYGLTYGEGLFVAVSADGTNQVMTSPDGITWTVRTAAQANQWIDVTYGNGQFVAVANTGVNRVMTSPDGITWTARTAAEANGWLGVTYGEGLFVAVANSGTNRVMTSPDGITWTARAAAQQNFWYDVTYGNGIFVAVGTLDAGTQHVMTSPNGITWTARTAAVANAWQSVTYGDGIFVSVAMDGNSQDSIMTSPDGITWTLQQAPGEAFWEDVIYADGVYVAVATGGIMTSTNAVDWTLLNVPEAQSAWLDALAYGNGRFVALDDTYAFISTSGGGEVIYTFSSDASTEDLTIASDGHLVAPAELSINGDYINNGTFTAGGGLVVFETAGTGGTGYDLAGEVYDSVSMSIADAGPGGLHFRSDGLKMYTNGWGSDLVREFTLSSAWDLSSASQVATYSVVSQDTWTGDVAFNDTGTKMYVTSDSSDAILEYAVSTPWSIASGVTYTDSTSIAAKESSPHGVEFSADGTKMYVSGSASDAVHTYSLSTPWDASTASFLRSYSVRAQDSTTNGISFSSDGTVMVMSGSFTSLGYKYTLSTPWEVSTSSITYTGDTIDFTLRSEFEPMQTAFSDDGTKLFMYGYNTGDVFQYTTGVAGTGIPDTDKELSGNMTGESAFADLLIAPTEESVVTFLDDAEVNDVEFGAAAQVTAPPVLTLNGNFANNGVFINNGGVIDVMSTTTFTGNLTGDSELGALVAHATDVPAASTWTVRTATAKGWSEVVYGNGLFVAVHADNDASDAVMTSPDGITWTDRAAAGNNDAWDAVTYGNGLFVAVGDATSGADPIMTSPDGITWTARTAPVVGEWSALTFGNGVFVALSRTGQIMSSVNGTAWTQRTSPAAVNWIDVTYGTLFVAVAQEGDVITSPDGTTWTSRTPAEMNDWTSIAYGNGTYVAVGNGVTNQGMTSPDGITWTARDIGTDMWADLIYADGRFVATVFNSLTGNIDVHTSLDGITWTMQTNPAGFWTSLAFGNGTFVALAGLPFFGGVAMSAPGSGVISTGITFGGNASTTDITLNEYTSLSAPEILTISDDFTNDGTFNAYDGTVYFDGTTAQTISGTTTTLFSDMVFIGSGNKTFTSNATTSDFTIASGATVSAPDSLTITGDYTNNGTFTKGSGVVYVEGVLSETMEITDAYDTSTAVVDGSPFSITAQETNPVGFAFSSDGTKMYITGYDSDAVSQYELSVAWDVTSASVDGSPFSVSGQDAFFEDIEFKSDGTKMYLLGSGNDRVYAYTLSIPWEISSASYDSAFASVNQDTNPFDIAFSQDGTRMYMVGATNDRVYSYTLSSAWVITSASYDNASYLISGQETSPEGLALSPDGTRMYVVGVAGDDVNQYALGTPWNVTTATVDGAPFSIAAEETEPTEIAFNDNGTQMFIVGSQANEINAYTLGSLTSATSGTTTLSGNMTGTSGFNDLVLQSASSTVGAIVFADNASTTNVTIPADSRIIAPALLSIAGDYQNNGEVEFGTGTTTFNGTTAQTINGTLSGTSAFNNVQVINTAATTSFEAAFSANNLTATSGAIIEFPAGATSTIASFDVVGTDGSEVILRSTLNGTQWGINAAAHEVSYVDIKDSTACPSSSDLTATDSVDSGNNLCWTITAPPAPPAEISSAENQVFQVGQATTSIATVTITDSSTPTITAANDLRIVIDSEVAMKWDTTDTTATYSGSASGKVSTSVSYENSGKTLVVPVNSNFAASDTLVVSGLSFSQFSGISVATTTLRLHINGALVDGGSAWTARSAAQANQWSSVTYGEGIFVAVADSGTNRVMTSPDGITWAVRSASSARGWNYVTYGEDIFVVVSWDGYVMTSPDGITWTDRTAAAANAWSSVIHGNGTFVAVSDNGTNRVMTSPDGITWTSRSAAEANAWYGLAYGEGLFVAVANGGTNRVMTSPDGITWTARAVPADEWRAVVYGNGQFVAVARDGDVMNSPDGITWTSRTESVGNTWQAVTYGNGVFVAVACGVASTSCNSTGGTSRVMTSPDGITWTTRSATEASEWDGIAFGEDMFVAVSYSGTNRVMTSSAATSAISEDDKTVAITGSFTVANHDAGQATNAFSYQNQTAASLYRFKLTPAGESATVSTMTFNLNGVRKINSTKLSNLQLYRDINNNGTYNAGDVQIGGAGVLTIVGQAGSIVFSTPFSATTSQNYILVGNVAGVKPNEFMTVSLSVSGSVTGATTLENIMPTGSVTAVQHIRGGDAGGASATVEIGGSAPAGSGIQTGGTEGGGSGVGNVNNGQTIGNEPGFKAPTATGEGFNEWTNGNGALLSDGVYATAASTNLRQTYGIFGFTVPSGNVVQGIEVKLEASGSTGAGTIQVALSWNGGSSITETRATTVLTNTDAVYTLGGPSDKWGRSWTPAEFSNANFFVRVIGQPNQNTVRVDAIQVLPYSYAGGGGGGAGGEI